MRTLKAPLPCHCWFGPVEVPSETRQALQERNNQKYLFEWRGHRSPAARRAAVAA